MANTYSRLFFHVVIAVRGRRYVIEKSWKDELYKYMTGTITKNAQKMMYINGMPDHVHLLIGTQPTCNLSDLVRIIKCNSSKWINEKGLVRGKFQWQPGFGAFTVGYSQLEMVTNYLIYQEQHHQKKTFRQEYIDSLKAHEIEYDEKYIFK